MDFHFFAAVEAFGDGFHGVGRDMAVVAAKMHQQRYLDLVGQVQLVLDAAAVVGDGGIDQAGRCRLVRQTAAEAVADRSDLAVDFRTRAQGGDGGGDVGQRLRVVGGLHQFDGALPARLVIAQFDMRAFAPEQVGHQHHIAVKRILLGHRADMFIDAKNFLQQHDARTLADMRHGQVGLEGGAVGAGDIDPLRSDAHEDSSSVRGRKQKGILLVFSASCARPAPAL